MDKVTFGGVIRGARAMKNISLHELAKMVEIDFSYLSKIENDKLKPPSEIVIKKLAKALDMDIDFVLAMANKIDSEITNFLLLNRDLITILRQMSEMPIKAGE